MRCSVAAGFPGASTVLPSAPRASRTLLFGPSKTTPQELVFLMSAKELVFLMSANEAQASSCSQGVDVCVCVCVYMSIWTLVNTGQSRACLAV